MNDEETVALIAGGHTFGKTHGAADPDEYVGREPEGAPIEEMGLGWKQTYGSGKLEDAITSGLEVTWTATPDPVGPRLLRQPLRPRVGADQEPRGRAPVAAGRRRQRRARSPAPNAGRRASACRRCSRPTSSLRFDPEYEKISRRFHENPEELADAFARAWFKLTHRDMGPIQRYLGPEVPSGDADLAGPGARRARASAPRTSRRSSSRSSTPA